MKTSNKDDIFKSYYSSIFANPRKYLFLLSSFLVLLLAVAGIWTQYEVRDSLNKKITHELTTIIKAELAAIDLWVKNEKILVQMWTQVPQVYENINRLVEIAGDRKDIKTSLLNSVYLSELRRTLEPISVDHDNISFLVVDRFGNIIATEENNDVIGELVSPESMAMSFRVLKGETVFLLPQKVDFFISQSIPSKPFITVASPVKDIDENIIAALVFRLDPEKDFSRILSLAQTGETGHIYLFNENGFMISACRFDDQLKKMGLIPDDPNESAILNVQLRDPGVNLLKRPQPDLNPASLPFTKMAASAISGNNGIDLKGYNDFRGVKVVGAWKWIKKYKIGIAVEADFYESFKPLLPIIRMFVGLFVVLILVSGLMILSTYNIQILKKRIKEVQRLGKYTLVEKIGEGGIGVVYKAEHAILRRPTAIKMLKPDSISPESVMRFEREVQLTSKLTHPNTVEIYDFGRNEKGIFYYVMEYLPGINLAEFIDIEGPVSVERVVYILMQICRSLDEAHSIGLVHRDIKPLNIILCQRGNEFDFVKVLDFGLIKNVLTKDSINLTAPDVIQGTPLYIAPEILSNPKNVDARADIYSLGVVAYNLLTGTNIYDITSPAELFDKALNIAPEPPSKRIKSKIPDNLDDLVLRCLAKDPSQRPQTVTDIIEELESINLDKPWSQKRARQWWATNKNRIMEKSSFVAGEDNITDDTVIAEEFVKKQK